VKKSNIKNFLEAAFYRAIRTVAQSAVASIGVAGLLSDVDWAVVVSTSILSGIVSLLMSVGGLPEVKEDNTDG